MISAELLALALQILEEMKAQDIETLDVRTLTDMVDTMLVCTATSSRHARAMADKLVSGCKAQGVQPLGVEGLESGEWILVDLTDVVVHIMLPETRAFYSLEKLWAVTDQRSRG